MGHYDEQYEAQDRERAERLQKALNGSLRELEGEVRELKSLPKDHPKGRDIAIAITHIETAILWLKK